VHLISVTIVVRLRDISGFVHLFESIESNRVLRAGLLDACHCDKPKEKDDENDSHKIRQNIEGSTCQDYSRLLNEACNSLRIGGLHEDRQLAVISNNVAK
jgi:hypothetical protein